MIERIYPRKVVCRGRKRPSALYVMAIALLLVSGLLVAVMQKAQATRSSPISSAETSAIERHEHVAGSVTLAEMIELQRIKRAHAAARSIPAAKAVAEAQAGGRWEVQFGAFAGLDTALRLKEQLNARMFGGHAPAIENIEGLYRVQSTAPDRAAATSLCAKAKADRFACFVRER